uniref:Galectin n=1 Tax=Paramormyrops kingsleyae TaxID=1676925 RepID=A0A3B3R9Q9_9TELE
MSNGIVPCSAMNLGSALPRLTIVWAVHVNLQCGSWAEADVALHFNPRFDSHPAYVVLNTYRNSAWGAEERKYEAPFPRGSTFTLTIMVSP